MCEAKHDDYFITGGINGRRVSATIVLLSDAIFESLIPIGEAQGRSGQSESSSAIVLVLF